MIRFMPISRVVGVATLALVVAGCGGLYPVSGTVTLEDGTPLTKGLVVFESADGNSMARGPIQSDGSFKLGSNQPGDGVRPGKYRALISGFDLTDVPDEMKNLPFDAKYMRFQTSGLEFEVEAKPNVFQILLKKSARSRRT